MAPYTSAWASASSVQAGPIDAAWAWSSAQKTSVVAVYAGQSLGASPKSAATLAPRACAAPCTRTFQVSTSGVYRIDTVAAVYGDDVDIGYTVTPGGADAGATLAWQAPFGAAGRLAADSATPLPPFVRRTSQLIELHAGLHTLALVRPIASPHAGLALHGFRLVALAEHAGRAHPVANASQARGADDADAPARSLAAWGRALAAAADAAWEADIQGHVRALTGPARSQAQRLVAARQKPIVAYVVDSTDRRLDISQTAEGPADALAVTYAARPEAAQSLQPARVGVYVAGQRVHTLLLAAPYVDTPRSASPQNVHAGADVPADWRYDTLYVGPTDAPGLARIKAGTPVRLIADDHACAHDFAITHLRLLKASAPVPMPEGYVPVTAFGVMPDAEIDQAEAINQALAAAPKLYFPKGTYRVDAPAPGRTDGIGLVNPGQRVSGAGIWHTRLVGPAAGFACAGAKGCRYADFAVFGAASAVKHRWNQACSAFVGPANHASLWRRVWIEHVPVGISLSCPELPVQASAFETSGSIRDVRIGHTKGVAIALDDARCPITIDHTVIADTADSASTKRAYDWATWLTRQIQGPASDVHAAPMQDF